MVYERFESMLRTNMLPVVAPANVVYDFTVVSNASRYVVGENFDAYFVAWHREAIWTLLPYDDSLDRASWYYSQHSLNLLATLLFVLGQHVRIGTRDFVANNHAHAAYELAANSSPRLTRTQLGGTSVFHVHAAHACW